MGGLSSALAVGGRTHSLASWRVGKLAGMPVCKLASLPTGKLASEQTGKLAFCRGPLREGGPARIQPACKVEYLAQPMGRAKYSQDFRASARPPEVQSENLLKAPEWGRPQSPARPSRARRQSIWWPARRPQTRLQTARRKWPPLPLLRVVECAQLASQRAPLETNTTTN